MRRRILSIAASVQGDVKEKDEVITSTSVIAERKSFLSSKKLTYTFKVRIDDENKKVKFCEYLKESGSGLSADSGIGFSTTTYNTLGGARSGTIEEDFKLFGKKYQYSFDYSKVRKEVEEIAKMGGYTFEYQISPIGI